MGRRSDERGGSRRDEKKIAQLCAQVRESISLTLADSYDEILLDLFVVDVVPAPDATRLCVRLEAPADADPEAIREAVEAARTRIRGEMAEAIHRKRVPSLLFELIRQE